MLKVSDISTEVQSILFIAKDTWLPLVDPFGPENKTTQ